ncbi:5-formyltetrahydrofolate cyclo-ligase [Gracilimonas sp. Q87]|uniref:5-formyltetrahydrofolate cyclo-ligase n=1 Tax=Gracilimonas sp. Q87 TaxID=3384766 RepID=UPI003983DD6F
MSDKREQKTVFRKTVLKQREQFDTKTWRNKSDLIIKKVQNLEQFITAKYIHLYVSMNERNEVETESLIDEVLESGKHLVVPVTNFRNGTLTHSILSDKSELKQNKWGVKEPKTIKQFDISKLDLIIIPMAAADRSGNRLGYGKGFYDRFLNNSNAFKTGLVFSDFLFEEIPTEAFDEKLDAIITDKEVIYT